jgi:threonylcarbamoyladenosine tRNA methylthiotransferase MtaB
MALDAAKILPVRVLFTNLGCKLNQAEIEELSRDFRRAGHQVVSRLEDSDLHVVNSCTVTSTAARASRKAARRASRSSRAVSTVLTGCYAAAEPATAAAVPGVDLVVLDKERLLERVHATFPALRPSPGAGSSSEPDEGAAATTRAFLKIEDGCGVRCAFCVIPKTRGRQRSRPLDEVLRAAEARLAGGHRELVVTGVQISSWRDQGRRLADLVAALLALLPAAGARLRLSSIAPWQFDERLLERWSDRRLCRHVHLALQSGATATLRRMRRPYTTEAYARLVERVRATVPGMAVTTDVIVGFPGESEEDFRTSLATVAALGFARVHVFPFSARPGTAAAELPGQLPPSELALRMERMLAAAARAEEAFRSSCLGARAEVLWERPRGGVGNGLTDTYLRVWSLEAATLWNQLSKVELVALAPDGLSGRLVA